MKLRMLWLLMGLMLAARGLSGTNLANAWLSSMRGGGSGTTFTAPSALYSQLHTGDPGSAGTSNVSSTTTRQLMAFAAPSAGSMSLSTQPSWTSWAGTNGEVVTDASCWSASTSGTFYFSTQFTVSRTVNTGDTITVTSWTFSLAPLAA